jgi:hypothetical protein
MNKVVHVITAELRAAILPIIFFLVVFHLVDITKTLILEAYRITPTSAVFATIGALIIAKAVLIADKLPFISLFATKPLMFTVLWKTLNYSILFLVFRCIEEIIPLVSKYGSLGGASEHLIDEVSWPHFWAIQIWLIVSLLLYTLISEFVGLFGAEKFKKALFGSKAR